MKFAYNPVGTTQVDFNDWKSESNAYKSGFIWTPENDSTICFVPVRNNIFAKQSGAELVGRKIMSGHPYLIWNTKYGKNQNYYLFTDGSDADTSYPIFRMYHPASRSVMTNIGMTTPGGTNDCQSDRFNLYRVGSGTDFSCSATGDNKDREKCYLFSMWHQCGYLGNNDGDMKNLGNPHSDCYKVLNMPTKGDNHKQMLMKNPSYTVWSYNPEMCRTISDPGLFSAVAVTGTNVDDASYGFDFYDNANLDWPPDGLTDPWVQPIQFCVSPVQNHVENYYNCYLYAYTFGDTDDASTASRYVTVGWLTPDDASYTVTKPTTDATNVSVNTTNKGSSGYEFKYLDSNRKQYLSSGKPFADSSYTSHDKEDHVFPVAMDSLAVAIYFNDTGLLYTTINGKTCHLCSYESGTTKKLLWIDLNGDYSFDKTVTIRCPFWAIYYPN